MFVEYEPLFDFDHINKHHYVKAQEYHDRYWQRLISTKPANHKRAESAAYKLAWPVLPSCYDITWVSSPEEGQAVYAANTTHKPHTHWLTSDPSDYLDEICPVTLRATVKDLLHNVCSGLVCTDNILSFESMYTSTTYHIAYDLPWLVTHLYAQRLLGFYVGRQLATVLHYYDMLSSSCAALWIGYDKLILCERPSKVDIDKGRVINMVWDR